SAGRWFPSSPSSSSTWSSAASTSPERPSDLHERTPKLSRRDDVPAAGVLRGVPRGGHGGRERALSPPGPRRSDRGQRNGPRFIPPRPDLCAPGPAPRVLLGPSL